VSHAARRLRTVGVVLAVLLAVGGLAACREDTPTVAATDVVTPASAEDFAAVGFHDSTHVDNRWFPLVPGTQMTWVGHALDDDERIERKVVFTVTDLVKEIDGVPSRVIWELDYSEGELEEAELAFFAQDDAGTVWHMGEYPEEFDGGEVVKHPGWIAGLQDALPGIHMPASPALDTPSYAQGWGPQVGWDDRGDTYALDEQTCTRLDCYDGVLVNREFSRSEPGAFQLKYYAPGVGNVRVGYGGPNEDEHEVLVLTERVTLDADALAAVRDAALALVADAYRLSPALYGATAPAEQSS
jgi:hypothetical protein